MLFAFKDLPIRYPTIEPRRAHDDVAGSCHQLRKDVESTAGRFPAVSDKAILYEGLLAHHDGLTRLPWLLADSL